MNKRNLKVQSSRFRVQSGSKQRAANYEPLTTNYLFGLAWMSSPPHKLADPPLAEIFPTLQSGSRILGTLCRSIGTSGEELMTPARYAEALARRASPEQIKGRSRVIELVSSRVGTEKQLMNLPAGQADSRTNELMNALKNMRAGTDVLQKILRGKIFWLTPSRLPIGKDISDATLRIK